MKQTAVNRSYRSLHLLNASAGVCATLMLAAATTLTAQDLTPVFPIPSEAQLRWQDLEYYAFFHYGMNTFTGQQWGDGSEQESLFAPDSAPDVAQWLTVAQSAGMKGGVAVVKHHDGFCLWPTQTTTHCVTSCATQAARDLCLPLSFALAADSLGMAYGFYLSPWDRNAALFGTADYMQLVYIPQVLELLQLAPHPFELWMDGANNGYGYYGGACETRSINAMTYYDTPNLRALVRQSTPDCMVALLTSDVRWVGNEAGIASETCWCMSRYGATTDQRTGDADGWCWNPAEADLTIYENTNKWFYEDGLTLRTAEDLFMHYLITVGRNCNFILNLAPDRSGRLPASTVELMAELGSLLHDRLGHDLAPSATITADVTRAAGTTATFAAANLTDGDAQTAWAAPDGVVQATITLSWPEVQTLRYVSLQEQLQWGQRISSFAIDSSLDGVNWQSCATSVSMTTVGHRRIIPLAGSAYQSYDRPVEARYLRIRLLDARACPVLHTISIF